MPDRKVTLGALGGALGLLIVWVTSAFAGITIPAEPAMALQTIVVFVLQWVYEVIPHTHKDKDGDGIPD